MSKRGSKATVMVKLKLDKDCCNYHGERRMGVSLGGLVRLGL